MFIIAVIPIFKTEDSDLEKQNFAFDNAFWAKKSISSGLYKWVPLKQHLIDTMNISGMLWEHWLSEGQKLIIEESLSYRDEDTGKRLAKFLGGIHDWAKATPAFQAKKSHIIGYDDLENQLIEKLENFGFTGIGTLVLSSANKSHHAIASQALLSKYLVNEDIASIVGAHHGKPVDESLTVENQTRSYPANYYQIEDKSNYIHRKWISEQEAILNWVLRETRFDSIKSLPKIGKSAQVIFAGLLIMADWIASNEEYFPLININDDGASIDQIARLNYGWTKWMGTKKWEPENFGDLIEYYNNKFNFSPNELQEKVGDIITKSNNPGLIIIEAPMGIGKTEAALTAVEQLAIKNKCSGLYFGLPTMATSDGIFGRISSWLSKVSQVYNEKKSIQLVHGKAALNKEFKSISENIDVDGEGSSGVIVNGWFSKRKTAVLDDFVVGTVDHFLLSALKQKHLALRHMGLSKKVIVIDEVHAYDSYMGQYLNRAVSWMASYHTPIVLMSATLPYKTRSELVKSYLRGSGMKIKDLIFEDGWDTSENYPLITYTDGDSIKQLSDFKPKDPVKIKINRIRDEDVIELLSNLLSDGGVAGIVVNTVRRAQNLAKELSNIFGEDTIELLHSSFLSSHRIEKERKFIGSIGKNGDRPFKKITIGTQVIEQSLDIDFDVMISDLAPMDLLLQRIGRLHRHLRKDRPELLTEPNLYVLGTDESYGFEKGSISVYGKYLLMKTQMNLPPEIYIPTDVSRLVQVVYNIDNDNPEDSELQKAKQDMKNEIAIKKQRAETYLLDKPKNGGKDPESLVGWLKNAHLNDNDEKGFAQVRDTEDSIEVLVVKKTGTGYSVLSSIEDISGKIHEFEVGQLLATQSLKLPNVLCKSYTIDKTIEELEIFNKEYLSKWQLQSWLKGSLGIILDEDNNFVLNGWKLHYSDKYGLEYDKEVLDE